MLTKVKNLDDPDVASKNSGLEVLYQHAFPIVASFVSKHGGTFEEAKDVFHDAFTIYYEKITASPAVIDGDAYLLGIARHLWYKQHKSHGKYVPLDMYALDNTESEENLQVAESKLLAFIAQAGSKCMEILRSFYYDKLSMAGLSSRFGFGSERSATVQKYKCLEKVRDKIREKNKVYEDFFE